MLQRRRERVNLLAAVTMLEIWIGDCSDCDFSLDEVRRLERARLIVSMHCGRIDEKAVVLM